MKSDGKRSQHEDNVTFYSFGNIPLCVCVSHSIRLAYDTRCLDIISRHLEAHFSYRTSQNVHFWPVRLCEPGNWWKFEVLRSIFESKYPRISNPILKQCRKRSFKNHPWKCAIEKRRSKKSKLCIDGLVMVIVELWTPCITNIHEHITFVIVLLSDWLGLTVAIQRYLWFFYSVRSVVHHLVDLQASLYLIFVDVKAITFTAI